MEAVMLSTLATQAALYALSQRAARPQAESSSAPPSAPAPAATPSSTSNGALTNGADEPAAYSPVISREEHPTASEGADEEVDITPVTIASLEAEIDALRSQASYSADTLVAASRADRKANELEAKLKVLRASQPRNPNADIMGMLQRFGVKLPGGGASASAPLASRVQSFKHAGIVRFVSFLLLYLYFRRRGDRFVLRLPCDALWPLAWPLSTSLAPAHAACAASDAAALSCAAGDACGVSYYVFAILAGGVFQLAVNLVRAQQAKRK